METKLDEYDETLFQKIKEHQGLCFEDWVIQGMSKRPDCHAIKTNVVFYACMSNIGSYADALREVSKKSSGMFKAETNEFKDAQKDWWFLYKKILILRSFLLHFFDFPAPNWKELMPERLYCGTLLSEEDFNTYMQKPSQGLEVKTPETKKESETTTNPFNEHEDEELNSSSNSV